MANEKQRRRRAKEKRHAYDLVEIDSEGNETVLSASEVKSADLPKKKTASPAKPAGRGSGRRGEPQPPSWTRVLKRGAIAAPAFFALVMILGKLDPAAAILQTMFLLVLFIPFSYLLDGFVYRSYQKRIAKSKTR